MDVSLKEPRLVLDDEHLPDRALGALNGQHLLPVVLRQVASGSSDDAIGVPILLLTLSEKLLQVFANRPELLGDFVSRRLIQLSVNDVSVRGRDGRAARAANSLRSRVASLSSSSIS